MGKEKVKNKMVEESIKKKREKHGILCSRNYLNSLILANLLLVSSMALNRIQTKLSKGAISFKPFPISVAIKIIV